MQNKTKSVQETSNKTQKQNPLFARPVSRVVVQGIQLEEGIGSGSVVLKVVLPIETSKNFLLKFIVHL